MALTDIIFAKGERNYISDTVQVNSAEIGLQITFEKGGKLWVYISYDGEKYSVVETRNFTTLNFARPVVESRNYDKKFARPIVGIIPGQYIKIECETQPVKAQYFESEE